MSRTSCPICAYSEPIRNGRIVTHEDPRWGQSGKCPGSGRQVRR